MSNTPQVKKVCLTLASISQARVRLNSDNYVEMFHAGLDTLHVNSRSDSHDSQGSGCRCSCSSVL
jgi:hypothetical protein